MFVKFTAINVFNGEAFIKLSCHKGVSQYQHFHDVIVTKLLCVTQSHACEFYHYYLIKYSWGALV